MAIRIPSLLEMLQAGVHFGHQKSRWYPKMKSYIFGERNGVHILDLVQTQKKLRQSLEFIYNLSADKKVIVFVGTKKQAASCIKESALECGSPYVNQRWLGGTLTNFGIILKLINKYKGLKRKKEAGELLKYTKKEQLEFDREIARLDKIVGGIETLEKLPDALFVVDIKIDKTAITEARKRHIPIIALCDTNSNPELVTHPIPSNDDATKAITMMIHLVRDAVKQGKLEAARREISSDAIVKAKKEAEAKRKESTDIKIDDKSTTPEPKKERKPRKPAVPSVKKADDKKSESK